MWVSVRTIGLSAGPLLRGRSARAQVASAASPVSSGALYDIIVVPGLALASHRSNHHNRALNLTKAVLRAAGDAYTALPAPFDRSLEI